MENKKAHQFCGAMTGKTLLDLPNEIFRDCLFQYLGPMDIFSLGETGNKRLKDLAVDYNGYSQGQLMNNGHSILSNKRSLIALKNIVITSFTFFRLGIFHHKREQQGLAETPRIQ